jgi:RimJ/RimL family protein N-acetyltransferase
MPFPIPDLSTCIETARLSLRPYCPGDGAWYYPMALRNKAHLGRFESGNAVMSIGSQEDAERIVTEFAVGWAEGKVFFLGAFERESGKFVAQIYVGVVNRDLPEFEVGFFADAGHEGQGYVSEAVRAVLPFLFGELSAHRVRLECDDTNERSARVAERCEFTLEGHIRENHLWPDGRITGTLHYGLLRREHRSTSGVVSSSCAPSPV